MSFSWEISTKYIDFQDVFRAIPINRRWIFNEKNDVDAISANIWEFRKMPKASAASCNLVIKDRWQGNRKYPKVRTGVENPCQLWLGVHAQLGNPRCVDFHGEERAGDSISPSGGSCGPGGVNSYVLQNISFFSAGKKSRRENRKETISIFSCLLEILC